MLKRFLKCFNLKPTTSVSVTERIYRWDAKRLNFSTLDIYGLSIFEQLPDEVLHGLRSLKKLSIVRCEKFKLSESFQYLTCLEKLIIQSCSKIEGLHEALQHMIALQSLSLSDLPNLASLPNDLLGNLGLLQELEISNCPKLVCLPMSIQHLTSLKQLGISDCSELGKRCKENTGEDWHKIAHIQHIQVKNQSHEARVIFRAG
ncbi:unnamed protein product [Vicia faba]|uniref:Disease resistance protein At4g27190-like leucine-rich repeats domain-containing protein n=1 Tax=Vicia faba TaxID=3906 RepID=A0AAV0YPJ6_VICFA|nr:unnamed protein product [Vicia faba]